MEGEEGQQLQELMERTCRFSFDRSLISCLVDRWRPETHTFHFPWGEMAPTLQDVAFLLGLPLAGEAVGPMEPPQNWEAAMIERFAGLVPDYVGYSGNSNGPKWTWLSQFQVSKDCCTTNSFVIKGGCTIYSFEPAVLIQLHYMFAGWTHELSCRPVDGASSGPMPRGVRPMVDGDRHVHI